MWNISESFIHASVVVFRHRTYTKRGSGKFISTKTCKRGYNTSEWLTILLIKADTANIYPAHRLCMVSIVGSLHDREVACWASDRHGSNFESCVWRTVSSQSSHHPQEVLLAQFSLYVHKGGLKPDSFLHGEIFCLSGCNICTYYCFVWRW